MAQKRGGLGRGLDALFGENTASEASIRMDTAQTPVSRETLESSSLKILISSLILVSTSFF